MSYIPSNRMDDILARARIGIWVDALYDDEFALVAKIPNTIIKAIYRDVQTKFVIAVVRVDAFALLCLGLVIEDDPAHPFCVLGPAWESLCGEFLKKTLDKGTVPLRFFDELNHPLLESDCVLNAEQCDRVARKIDAEDHLLFIDATGISDPHNPSWWAQAAKIALDSVQAEVYRSPTLATQDPSIEVFAKIALTVSPRTPAPVYDVSPSLCTAPFVVDDADEGHSQERALQSLLDELYHGNAHLNPLVQHGNKDKRELTDVLCIGSTHLLLLESKAVAVLKTDLDRPTHRRVAAITKDIKTATNQLRGALRALRSGNQVYTSESQPLTHHGLATKVAHAVVLVSEMNAFLDWQKIAQDIIALSEDDSRRALFHVMDMAEMSALVRASQDEGQLDEYLVQRWAVVRKKGTGYVRAQPPWSAFSDQ